LRQSVKSYVSGIAAVRLLCSEFGLRARSGHFLKLCHHLNAVNP
jgi:hypothetical protein